MSPGPEFPPVGVPFLVSNGRKSVRNGWLIP